ncbi:hypothetical protein Hesp01_42520 [Herbidospora sp. NBRC 101105]|nr:hypothetical protein Hesp01_42520 [Herbidospora sp. NBRC 101105]
MGADDLGGAELRDAARGGDLAKERVGVDCVRNAQQFYRDRGPVGCGPGVHDTLRALPKARIDAVNPQLSWVARP